MKACGTLPPTAAGGGFFLPLLLFLGASVPARRLHRDEKDDDNPRVRKTGHLFCLLAHGRPTGGLRVGLEEMREERGRAGAVW